jgi:hypothetical protein
LLVLAVHQFIGAVAIVVSLVGTWLAAKHRAGWLICVASSTVWFPALATGNQWAAVSNCGLSIAICLRSFWTQAEAKHGAGPARANRIQ